MGSTMANNKYSEWAWKAGDIWLDNPSDKVCRHRVGQLGLEMVGAKEPFDLVVGQNPKTNEKHTWIEHQYNGNIEYIEPTQLDGATSRERYSKQSRYRVNQGRTGEDYIGAMFLNRWMREIEGEK